MRTPNKTAAPSLALAAPFQIERHWRRVGNPRRSASMRFLVAAIILLMAVVTCRPGAKLGDLSKVTVAERDVARNNWERVEKAFKAGDDRALKGLVGCKVLVLVDATGSPWTGKALSVEERAASAGDANRLSEAKGERATQIAREIGQRREKAWQMDCKIDFTQKQARHHFIWPDAVFGADVELLGTLTKASLSRRSICIKPVAIDPVILQL